jgi:hypothetical protein
VKQEHTWDLNEDYHLIAGAVANHQLHVVLARSFKSCCESPQIVGETEPGRTFWISLFVRNGEESQ